MQLTETGESRVNGYLFVLERSLKSFLPHDVAREERVERTLEHEEVAVDARLAGLSELHGRAFQRRPSIA